MEESSGSNATPPQSHTPAHPSQLITDRIVRAIRHRLLLLHRVGGTFFVLGATGNVYTVTLSTTPSCTCPDRTKPCKHILFILIRALGVPPEAPCLKRRTLRPCQLSRLLVAPTQLGALAGANLQNRFHELFQQSSTLQPSGSSSKLIVENGDGTVCPVCLEEMERGESAERCRTCRNLIHEECLLRWRRSRGRRFANCVVCRAKWVKVEKDKYFNLAAYAGADDNSTSARGRCGYVDG